MTGNFDEKVVDEVRREMGLKRLSPTWAKLEIAIGLSIVAIALIRLRDNPVGDFVNGAMFVLGAYLAMAGHRSHLYQAANRQTAYLASLISCGGGDTK